MTASSAQPGPGRAGFAGRLVIAAVVWMLLLGVLIGGYVYVVAPLMDSRTTVQKLTDEYNGLLAEAAVRGIRAAPIPDGADEAEIRGLIDAIQIELTAGSDTGAVARVPLSLDGFSGYAVLRSDEMASRLRAEGLALEFVDDGADYAARLARVASGETPLAVFSVDSLLVACAESGTLPATIVMVIDETVGADALVAYESGLPTLDALNRNDGSIVATPASPSETLGRIVMGSFQMDRLRPDPFVPADGAAAVLSRFRAASRTEPTAYALWEPYVSEALREPGAHVLIDSADFRGFIIDVLVAQREYLLHHEDRVEAVVRAYFQANHDIENGGARPSLVQADAGAGGSRLTAAQARLLVDGIWWKNTTENYAHFGLRDAEGVEPLSRAIPTIARVLLATGGMDTDPTGGRADRLYYDRLVGSLADSGFHPNAMSAGTSEAAREAVELRALSDQEWDRLIPVGTLQTERLVFPRGTAVLTQLSERTLARLAETLDSFHRYYVVVQGNAAAVGNASANQALAEARAAAASGFLRDAGIDERRIRISTRLIGGSLGQGQSVSFLVGEMPY